MLILFLEMVLKGRVHEFVDPLGVDVPHTGEYNHIGPKDFVKVKFFTHSPTIVRVLGIAVDFLCEQRSVVTHNTTMGAHHVSLTLCMPFSI